MCYFSLMESILGWQSNVLMDGTNSSMLLGWVRRDYHQVLLPKLPSRDPPRLDKSMRLAQQQEVSKNLLTMQGMSVAST